MNTLLSLEAVKTVHIHVSANNCS